MTRPRAADDFDTIERRVRELRGENDKAIAGDPLTCDCPTSPNVHGVEIKAHRLGCPAIVTAALAHYSGMLEEATL